MKQTESLWTAIMEKLSKKPLVRFNKRNLYIGYGEKPEEIRLPEILRDRLLALCTEVTSSSCPEYQPDEAPKRFVVYKHGNEHINLDGQIFVRYVKYDKKGMILINSKCIPHLKGVTLPCRVPMKRLAPHLLCFGIYQLGKQYLINSHYHTINSGSKWVTYINKDKLVKLCTYKKGTKAYSTAQLCTHQVMNIFQTLNLKDTINALHEKVDKKTPFWYILKPLLLDLPTDSNSLHDRMLKLIPKVKIQDRRLVNKKSTKGLEFYFMDKVLSKISAYENAHNAWAVQHYPEYEHLYDSGNLKIASWIIDDEKKLLEKKDSKK